MSAPQSPVVLFAEADAATALSPLAREFTPKNSPYSSPLGSPAPSPAMSPLRGVGLSPYSPPYSPAVPPAYLSLSPSTAPTDSGFSLGKSVVLKRTPNAHTASINPHPVEPLSVIDKNKRAPSSEKLSENIAPAAEGTENEQPRDKSSSSDEDNIDTMVRRQIEYYFSHENLLGDKFLLEEMEKDPQCFVGLEVIMSFNRIIQLTTDSEVVVNALKASKRLSLDPTKSKVRRKKKFTANTGTNPKMLRKCLRVTGLPADSTVQSVKAIFDIPLEEGDVENHVVYVKFDEPEDHTWAWVGFTKQQQAQRATRMKLKTDVERISKMDYLTKIKEDNKARRADRRKKKQAASSPSLNPQSPGLKGRTRRTSSAAEPGRRRNTRSELNWRLPSGDTPPSSPTLLSKVPKNRARGISYENLPRGVDDGARNDPRFQQPKGRPRFVLKKKSATPNESGAVSRIRMAKGPDSSEGFNWEGYFEANKHLKPVVVPESISLVAPVVDA